MINIIITYVLITFSLVDLILTHNYISEYKLWQQNKPYHLIELNPLLVLLMTHLGTNWGMFIGGFIILVLISVIGLTANIYISIVLGLFLLLAIYNHIKNTRLLYKLIDKYPTGHLPEKVFGKVEGNNLNQMEDKNE